MTEFVPKITVSLSVEYVDPRLDEISMWTIHDRGDSEALNSFHDAMARAVIDDFATCHFKDFNEHDYVEAQDQETIEPEEGDGEDE